MMQRKRDAALFYAHRSWPILPLCWPNHGGECGCGRSHTGRDIGKAPLTPHGWEDATTDPTRIAAWLQRLPNANIGIALEPPGLLVLDLDSAEAAREAVALSRQTHGLPPAPISRTGGGGWQYIFKRANGCPAANSTRRGTSGKIDILAKGYVVAPPSLHRSGRAYHWELPPDDQQLYEAPDWAVRMLTDRPAVTATAVTLPDDLPEISLDGLDLPGWARHLLQDGPAEGAYPSRSEALFAAIAALVRAGCDDTTIAGAAWASPVGAKAREQGQPWLSSEIGRVRAKVRASGAIAVPLYEGTPDNSCAVRPYTRSTPRIIHSICVEVAECLK